MRGMWPRFGSLGVTPLTISRATNGWRTKRMPTRSSRTGRRFPRRDLFPC
jgi:hypothetical protein